MSQNDLFAFFPTITYNGQTAIDITKSVKMVSNLVSNSAILTPYTLNQSIRSDQLAAQAYGDPYLEWLIFLSNQQVDGYDWFMDQNQFYTYLNNKYGDWVVTQQQVAYWINNWYTGEGITVSAFDALDPSLVKYYEPTFDAGGHALGYTRRQVDWTVSTNHLVQFAFANTVSFPTFVNNEVVTVKWTSNNTFTGQVCFQSNTINQLNVQHVNGDYNFANTINAAAFSVVGSQSNATLTISNSNDVSTTIYDTVSELEDIFYSPVTIYDDENIKNEARKYMFLLPNAYVTTAMLEMKTIFQ